MSVETSEIVKKANHILSKFNTRNPRTIAQSLGITIMPEPFDLQKGAYKVILRNPFIFINENLDEVMTDIVLCHEIGHHILHRGEAIRVGGFKEFNIFDMRSSRMEYEANIFASQLALDDTEFLEYATQGYDIQQIARAMNSDINLVALKSDTLIAQGYRLRPQEHRNDFLK